MSASTQPTSTLEPGVHPAAQDWTLGWRYVTVPTPNGRTQQVRTPLTAEEARHPEEGYVMPERTEHDLFSDDLCDMLRAYFEERADVAVFRNLVFKWDHPDVGSFAPDVAVVPNVRERMADRTQFVVADEGTRPLLAIEVVSRSSREDDRVLKVRDYARVGVQEYVYIEHAVRRRQDVWELVGFRLQVNQYLPLLPDEDGALYLESVNLRIGLTDGRVWLEDAATGNDLLNNLEVRRALRASERARLLAEERVSAEEQERLLAETRAALEEQSRLRAEERAAAEEQARQAAEARIAELEAELQALRNQQK